jgi:hypothetical protein
MASLEADDNGINSTMTLKMPISMFSECIKALIPVVASI